MVFDGVAYALVEALPTTPVAPGWTTAGALDVRLSEGAVSTDGTRIYATHGQWFNTAGSTIGPSSGGRVITSAGVVDSLPSASVARRGVAGAWCNGKHYAIGGLDSSDSGLRIIEAYTPSGANGASGVWTTLAIQPQSLAYQAAAVVGNTIYAAGGQSTSTPNTTRAIFLAYDTAGNTWTTLAPMPAERAKGVLVAYQGKLYYLGGNDSAGTRFATVYVYNIAAGTWSTGTALSAAANRNAGALVGDTVYSAGGTTGNVGSASTVVSAYNLITGATTTGPASLSSHGDYPGMLSIGGALYLISGADTANVDRIDVNASGSFGASVQAVQAVTALAGGAAAGVAFALPTTIPTAPGWATVGIVPETYRYDAAVSSDGTRAYVSHGYHQGTATNNELTPSAFTVTADGSFAMMPNSPTARIGAAGAFCNGKHYAIGGLNSGNTAQLTVEAYTPAGANGASGIWSTVANYGPGSIAYASSAVVGNFIYSAGGQAGVTAGAARGAFSRYDTTSNTWTNLADMPDARTVGAMVAYQGKLYYLGGLDSNGTGRPEVYVYDIAGGTWSTASYTLSLAAGNGWTRTLLGAKVYSVSGTFLRILDLLTGTETALSALPSEHASGGLVAIGSSLYAISGAGNAKIDSLDTASKLTAYQSNLALLKALVAA